MSLNIGQWASIGPTRINDGGLGSIGRIHSIAVHPTTPTTLWAGGPNCGIWKTNDGAVFQVWANGERVVLDRGVFLFAAEGT